MIDIQQINRGNNQGLKVSYIGKDGNRDFKFYPISRKWYWEYTTPKDPYKDKNFVSWDNKPVKRTFQGRFNKLSVHEFLWNQIDSDELFEYNTPRMHFCDIEVISGDDKFPNPEEAKWAVNTIAVVNQTGTCVIVGDKPLTPKQISEIEVETNEHFKNGNFKNNDIEFKVVYVYRPRERDLLTFFFQKIMPKVTLLTGWYFIDFDWKYLINRANKIGLDVESLMGTRLLYVKDKDTYLPRHTLVVDYKEIYQKWDTTVKVKENNTLDYVSEQALGVKKISYKGSLKDLYNKDYKKFVLYNNIDSALLHFLDQKLNTMTTFLKIGLIAKVPHQQAFSAVRITERFFFYEMYKNGKILLNDPNITPINEQYPGAYVKKPVVGLHEDVAAFDFASLYPKIMIQFMISPEYYLGIFKRLDNNTLDDIEFSKLIHNIYKRTHKNTYVFDEVEDMIELFKNKYEDDYNLMFDQILKASNTDLEFIHCENGAVFEKRDDAAIPKILTDLYAKRKVAKGYMFQCSTEIDRLERLLETM